MKRILALLITVLISITVAACSTTPKDTEPLVESINYLDYTYKEVSATDFYNEFEVNPLRAEADYLNNYITFDGYVDNTVSLKQSITDTGSYSEVVYKTYDYDAAAPLEDVFISYEVPFGEYFMCTLNPSLPKEPMRREKITVWGKVTDLPDDDTSYCSVEVLHYEFADVAPQDEISYTEFTANQLFEQYLNDPQSAKAELYNAFVSITAPVREITSRDFRFARTTNDGYTFSYGRIECPFMNDEQKAILIEKNLGDSVTVKGRIAGISGDISHAYYTIELFGVK